MEYDLIIIGGGAAGCFAAITAAEQDARVLVLEHGKLMHKLGITGKGRCNLTNNCEITDVVKNLPTNGRFMQSALSKFSPSDTIATFNAMGIPLKTERGGRVFPVSDKAADITTAIKKKLDALGVTIIYDKATEILTEDKKVVGVKGKKGEYLGGAVILATGGVSYSKTGSTGDGYKMASRLGHEIITPKPSLVPIITAEDCSGVAGLTLKNVVLKLYNNKSEKPIYSDMGEMLFTHDGMSGPLVLSASVFIKSENYHLTLDLKPALNNEQLELRLLREFDGLKNKEIRNAARKLMPEGLIPIFLSKCGISPERRVHEVTREQRKAMIKTLKALRFEIRGLADIEQAIITDGGINVREINPATMESKIIKSLFFAGEIIDVAGFTGGFNLQTAFSTAYAAAVSSLKKV